MHAMIPMGLVSRRMGTAITDRTPSASNHVRLRTRGSCMTSVTTSGSWLSKTRPARPSPTLSVCRNSTGRPDVPVSARSVSRSARASSNQMRTMSTPRRVGEALEHLAQIEGGRPQPTRLGEDLELTRPWIVGRAGGTGHRSLTAATIGFSSGCSRLGDRLASPDAPIATYFQSYRRRSSGRVDNHSALTHYGHGRTIPTQILRGSSAYDRAERAAIGPPTATNLTWVMPA